jgi:primosomal protein N' (replication factor Y)
VEALGEELKKLFPRHRVEVFATDQAGRKKERVRMIGRFSGGDIDILAGTQLLAHQSGLPPVSLVGLLHPETVLHLADFRSGQKTYQAISRASRFLRPGADSEIVIQTADPAHFSIREAVRGDYRAFYRQEIRYRRLLDYPPFSSLADVVFQGENLRRVAGAARQFAARARSSGEGVKVFGPSLAPVSRIRGRHRVQVILKSRNRAELSGALRPALEGITTKKSLVFFE